ncbi:testin-like [Clytia hemisphaerica]
MVLQKQNFKMEEEVVDTSKDTDKVPSPSSPIKSPRMRYGSYSENLSKLILLHDHGIGSPCLYCQHCSGLELHFWRKTCKNCGCRAEDHEVQINESIHDSLVDSLLHMNEDDLSAFIEIESENEDLQSHPILKEFVGKSSQVKERKTSRLLPPPVAKKPSGENQSTSSMTEHKETPDERQEVTEDCQYQEKQDERKEDKRKQAKLLMKQIPAQDFDSQFCHDLDDFEQNELKCYRLLVQEEAIGRSVTKFNNFEHDIKCTHCYESINSSDPYKYAERLPRQQWHPDCFKCRSCESQLVANIYFVHEKNIYCGRHYGEQIKQRCNACDELIFAEKYTNAENTKWHTKHFCCYKCDALLVGKHYVVIDNQPMCVDCYHDNIADRCKTCTKPIEAGSQRVQYDTFNWHVNDSCFSCTECKKSLLDIPFLPSGENFFCSQLCLGVYSV